MLRSNRLLCALLVTACLSPAFAVPSELIFDRFGEERGFPSETITALYRDHAGFLWVGSREGLAVWDGYSVRVYEHEVGNADSLPDNSIRTIYEDRSNELWVGTNSGGLARLDRTTGRFERFRNDPKDPKSLSHDSVYAIAEDADGALWVGTQNGLNRFDAKTRAFERVEGVPNEYVYALKLDRSKRMWLAMVGGGFAWLDPKTRRVTRLPVADERDDNAFAIAEDPSGGIWFGTERHLYRFDPATGSARSVAAPELAPGDDFPIVTAIACDAHGTLWISTWNRGLIAFDTTTGASHGYRNDPQREDSLGADRLAAVVADASGDVWIGTWGRGLARFSATGDLFHVTLEPKLPYREITALDEDKSGTLWVGTWGKGLFRLGRNGDFSGIAPPDDPPLALRTVLSLAEQADGTMWAASMASLTRIDPVRGTATAIPVPSTGYRNAVAVDRAGTLWVGTGGSGLFRLERDGRSFTRFHADSADPSSLSDDFVTSVLVGSNGALWIGTRSGGLNVFDPKTGKAVRLLPSTTDQATIGHQHISQVLESRSGVVWAGTNGGGLARITGKTGGGFDVKRITTDDGLVNQNVTSLVEDDDGTIWIGTRHGLSRYDPASGRFHNYGLADGLPGVEFNPGAARHGRDVLWLGTSGGLLAIRPGSPFVDPPVAPTVVTDIRTLKGPMRLPAAAWETRSIDVAYGTPLSFSFAVLDFRTPHHFAYRLEGRSDAWTDLPGQTIALTDLPPGGYTMSVRGRSARGAWSETPPLAIHVTPPYWMTWWFRLAAGAGLIGIVSTVYATRTARLKQRNRELETLQLAREQALLEARQSQAELHGTYDRLRGLTRRLEDAKEEEKRRIARELHDDMGQVLSAIKINLKALGRLPDASPERGARLTDSIGLVDDMIGNVREIVLDLRPPMLDELGLIVALRGYAEGQSVRTGAAIEVEANFDAERLKPETAIAAFRIVQEAVHNAVRHGEGRHITVSVRVDSSRLLLSVRDDGRGFDVAEALQRAATGRHLGLSGMRERVEALGGRLELDSSIGQGAEIRASVPLTSEEAGS
ncbi:MAG TPA: two-component regulator propeller domain-containing protein [Candidatus Polarisedimenticolaceae bacterium]|nr:two-component regulator propeller domain-containing protein [Candidatus Polarisedimenticolaceae bacterium]